MGCLDGSIGVRNIIMIAQNDFKKIRKYHAYGAKDGESVVLMVAATAVSMAAQ